MKLPALVVLSLALGLAACGDSADEGDATSDAKSVADDDSKVVSTSHDPNTCERDAEGQLICLNERFSLKQCGDARVLGSMFRQNEEQGTYSYRTAFGLKNACVGELKEAATRSLLKENDKGEFVLERQDGYREMLIIGMQISEDGSVVEWERTKE